MDYLKTFPLQSISLEEAEQLQFKLIDSITRHFSGIEILSLGDLGVVLGENKPACTLKVENVLADFFDAEAAILVRGAGTGALRWSFISVLQPGGTLLIHDAPVYPTTRVTLESMGVRTVAVNFNDAQLLRELPEKLHERFDAVLVQHTRQKIDDGYDFEEVISVLKSAYPRTPIITDDNYAALKVPKIGCQAGADLATFSCFKTLGPEGIGVVLGKRALIEKIHQYQYSGGSQVQGHEAMAVLRGMAYAPVALAIQSRVCEEIVTRLNHGEVPHVRKAFIANAQSKVVLVEFDEEIAAKILELTPRLGAAAHPVGSESIYEIAPMIYRISGTFRNYDPSLEKRMLRINPMRSGAETVIRILAEAIEMIH